MSSRIKVLHILQSGEFAGAENVACKIIELFKGDKQIEMAYCSKSGGIARILENKGIQYYPISKLSLKEIIRVTNLYSPDIIHAHDASASVLSSFLNNKYNIISHLHSNPPWIRRFGRRSLLYTATSRRYKKILTVSESITNEAIFGRIIKPRTTNIGNPIDTNEINSKANINSEIKKRYDLLFIGRLALPKDPLRFIEIVSELKNARPAISAAMVGDGDLRGECLEQIIKLGLEENVDVIGFVENPLAYLKHSQVLCITSRWEGFGIAAIEALTLGRPVVCPPVGGLPKLVDSSCGLLCNDDQEYILEIERLLNDMSYWSEKSSCAIRRASFLDNIDLYKDNILSIYQGGWS